MESLLPMISFCTLVPDVLVCITSLVPILQESCLHGGVGLGAPGDILNTVARVKAKLTDRKNKFVNTAEGASRLQSCIHPTYLDNDRRDECQTELVKTICTGIVPVLMQVPVRRCTC
jgi:hypothetical protein